MLQIEPLSLFLSARYARMSLRLHLFACLCDTFMLRIDEIEE